MRGGERKNGRMAVMEKERIEVMMEKSDGHVLHT